MVVNAGAVPSRLRDSGTDHFGQCTFWLPRGVAAKGERRRDLAAELAGPPREIERVVALWGGGARKKVWALVKYKGLALSWEIDWSPIAHSIANTTWPRLWSIVVKNLFARFDGTGELVLQARGLGSVPIFRATNQAVLPSAPKEKQLYEAGASTCLSREEYEWPEPAPLPSRTQCVPLSAAGVAEVVSSEGFEA